MKRIVTGTITLLWILALSSSLVRPARATDQDSEPAVGLDHRVAWTTSRVVGAPEPAPPYKTEPIFEHLTIKQPLTFEAEPGTNDYLIIQHFGSWAPPAMILRISDDPDVRAPQSVLSLEGIAYGLDFHPNYLENGYVFVGMNVKNGDTNVTRVSRYTMDRRTGLLMPHTEKRIIQWESNGHNGGDLAFGKDGTLFISSGDGTSDSDTNLRGQDMTHLTSKILRIDVDHPDPGRAYSVPSDNPFVGQDGVRPETWAYGLRNPWRLIYDAPTDQLWTGVNGQDLFEFAILVEKGANYGWSITEGSQPFQLQRKRGPTSIVPPTVEHSHAEARSLTGGLVYHGDTLPDLEGAYVYGDWSTGKIWAVKVVDGRKVWHEEIADTPFNITGFGQTRQGDLVVIDHTTGTFHRLVKRTEQERIGRSQHFPRRLSQTGLYLSVADRQVHPGLVPYQPNSQLWSDGAIKSRYIAIPDHGTITFSEGWQGWNFPDGSVLVKEFRLDLADQGEAPIETRIMLQEQGEWVGYTYQWNAARTDAVLVESAGKDTTFLVNDPDEPSGVREQTWHYPSRAECMVCHSRAANFTLGLTSLQLNGEFDYRGHGGRPANQLRTLEHIGMFAEALPKSPEEMDHLVDPRDESADLELRVRSYLQSNCANCHASAGGGNALMELTFPTPRDKMRVVDIVPQHNTLGIAEARLIAPGDPDRSVLYQRISRRGENQMPPLATSIVDPTATRIVRDWILQLGHDVPSESDAD